MNETTNATTPATVNAAPPMPGALGTTLLIARRAALESLRDRTTLLTSIIFVLFMPALMVFAVIRPIAANVGRGGPGASALGIVMAVYLLIVGLLPATAAVGVTAGQFAGEKEQGSLTPLLASPASNVAIFGGKVLGAVVPAVVFSAIAESAYLGLIAGTIGADRLRLLPAFLSLTMVALVPGVAVLGAAVASLISSRVRTFNAAQQISSLALLPIMFAFFGLAFKLQDWGRWALFGAVAGLVALDVALVLLGAATWRREEALARR